ncbi:MAG: hypothetical protein OEY48_06285 [Gammaproteobacteria bacterium]|nr:hypothetical protein [Gammaproteobacteria bacterium]MDH5592440.1 hypothetical protein [Gammaproteobacteria bacterium]
MINIQVLKKESKRWQDEHANWMKEIEHWQSVTQRLVALLYMLDRALPEHSTLMSKHISLIEQHEDMMKCLECGEINNHCFPSCPDFKTPEQQTKFHQKMVDLHQEVNQQHQSLKKTYVTEMEKFSALARKLFDESELS